MSEEATSSPKLAAGEVLADVAYEHAVRGLDSQIAVLSELRTRANYLIVATAAVATLFGGLLLRGSTIPKGISLGAAVPLALLVVGFICALGALRPTGKQGARGELTLVASANAILALDGNDAVSARGTAARALEDLWDDNQPVIERLMGRLRLASVCLAGQVASWVLLFVIRQLL